MSKRTKAATATNGHTRVQTPAKADPVAIHQGRGLGALAAQLAELDALFHLTVDVKMAAEKLENPGASGVYMPDQIEASNAKSFLEGLTHRTHDLTDTIQDLILQSEPRTLDETLSLALIYKQLMSLYLCDLADKPDIINETEGRDRERKLDRAMEAIIRGLVHGAGATSPLLAGYADEEEELATWDEMRREATRLATRYPPKSGACAKSEDGEEART